MHLGIDGHDRWYLLPTIVVACDPMDYREIGMLWLRWGIYWTEDTVFSKERQSE